MNEIVQHIPAFVDTGDEPRPCGEFDTLTGLIAIPFVNRWALETDFHQFSLSGQHLIAEQRGGRSWWVVGTLRAPVSWLPQWDKGIYEVWDDGKPIDMPGRMVSFSCGDDVGLVDGRVLKRRGR